MFAPNAKMAFIHRNTLFILKNVWEWGELRQEEFV
jgi:hypothetical protein